MAILIIFLLPVFLYFSINLSDRISKKYGRVIFFFIWPIMLIGWGYLFSLPIGDDAQGEIYGGILSMFSWFVGLIVNYFFIDHGNQLLNNVKSDHAQILNDNAILVEKEILPSERFLNLFIKFFVVLTLLLVVIYGFLYLGFSIRT